MMPSLSLFILIFQLEGYLIALTVSLDSHLRFEQAQQKNLSLTDSDENKNLIGRPELKKKILFLDPYIQAIFCWQNFEMSYFPSI